MFITHLKIKNWRNFREADVHLAETNYLMGPNAAGKSNFLDIFRFLRDIANPEGGGLQQAFRNRGGMSRVRCLAARNPSSVGIEVCIAEKADSPIPKWRYVLEVSQQPKGKRQILIEKEEVYARKGKKLEAVLIRPNAADKKDPERLTQTALEQISANEPFREIHAFFTEILYLHLVPQLLRHGNALAMKKMDNDPFGQGFLEQIARTPAKIRDSRLRRIDKLLKNVIHDLEELRFERDEVGNPHLQMRYKHWRKNGGFQQESEFSDGTLRLIAFLWILMGSSTVILLEEPELSLHKKIIEQIPEMLIKAQQSRKKAGGQIFVSTHSEVILSSPLIHGQYLILTPSENGEGTLISVPNAQETQAMERGMRPADILLPKTDETVGICTNL